MEAPSPLVLHLSFTCAIASQYSSLLRRHVCVMLRQLHGGAVLFRYVGGSNVIVLRSSLSVCVNAETQFKLERSIC